MRYLFASMFEGIFPNREDTVEEVVLGNILLWIHNTLFE